MSKSIYDEVLDIIDRNFEFNNGHIVLGVSGRTKIEQALKQAQKQEQILNKIKEIINRDYDSYIVSMLEEPKRYDEIVKLIKELENE